MYRNVARAFLSAAAVAIAAAPALAETPAEFYKDKTVTLTIPTPPGASFDLYGRTLIEYMAKHIPGQPKMLPQYRPGAGGGIAAAYMYNKAPKDGTEIALVLAPTVLTPKMRKVRWDASEFMWLGSITARPSVVTVWHTAPATTLEEAKKKQDVMGATGKLADTYLLPLLLNAYTGTKFKPVPGYKGGAAMNNAMEKGETHGRVQYWTGWTSVKQHWLDKKMIIQLAQIGPRIPALPNVPSVRDLVPDGMPKKVIGFMETIYNVGMAVYAPPGVPADRFAALKQAFWDTMQDPGYRAISKKRKADVDPVEAAKIQALVTKAARTPDNVIAALKKAGGI